METQQAPATNTDRAARVQALQTEQLLEAIEMVGLGAEIRIALPRDADSQAVEELLQTFRFLQQKLPDATVSRTSR